MKKIYTLIIIILMFFSAQVCTTATEIAAENDALSNREIRAQVIKIKTKRIIIANALLLNDSQKEKVVEIYSSVIEKEAMLLAQLEQEKAIMKTLYAEESTSAQRRKQRTRVYNLQKAISDVEKQVDKDFKKILTHDQKVKFNRLRKEIKISDF